MSGDPRGFRYAMQALLQRQRWTLDQRRHELAQAQQRHREAAAAARQLDAMRREVIRQGSGTRFDPAQAQARLAWLCQLATRIAEQRIECESLQSRCRVLRSACVDAQLRLEAIEAHRERCLARHAMNQSRIQAALADPEWLAHWTKGGPPRAGREP